jgi:hypothetical protein
MAYVSRDFDYYGIDETTLGLDNGNLIVVMAKGSNPMSGIDYGYNSLKKSKDYFNEAVDYYKKVDSEDFKFKTLEEEVNVPKFPDLDYLKELGLDSFCWMRSNKGRYFSRQEFEHAAIANMILKSNVNPNKSVFLIDTFYGKYHNGKDIIIEYLKENNYKISENQIEFHDGGDRSVPIINCADILAFHVGLYLNSIKKKYNQLDIPMPFKHSKNIDYVKTRIDSNTLSKKERILLEKILDCYQPNRKV